MTDFTTPLAPRTGEADEQREQRHAVLRDLLGAYADRELPPETVAQMDAHLIGCAECRREVALQETIHGRLAAEPVAPPPAAMRARLAAALDAATPIERAATEIRVAPRLSRPVLAALAITGWAVAAALATLGHRDASAPATERASVRALAAPVHAVPLLDGILANYGRITIADLPGRARDLSAVRAAVGFPVEPLHGPAVRLLGAWTTEVGGEPAAVLAYRLEDRLVVQYQVAEDAFFRHPAIRAAVASRHLLVAEDGARSLVAWPGTAAGSVLVGSMPSAELAGVWSGERTH